MVTFKIHRAGDISGLRLEKSSGVPIADEAALKAVENATLFHLLPEAASEEPDILFSFDYNVFGGEQWCGISRRF